MKYSAVLAIVGSATAIQNYPPFWSFNVPNPVDAKNYPGAILTGHEIIMPKPSSFVDDDFDPLVVFN